MCPAHVYEVGRDLGDGMVSVEVTPSNCVQCGAITAKGGRLTPPEGGSGPRVHADLTPRLDSRASGAARAAFARSVAHARAIATGRRASGASRARAAAQPGGSGSPSDVCEKLDHDALERRRDRASASSAFQSASASMRREMWFCERRRRELEDGDDEQGERHRLGRAHPASPPRRAHEDPRAGNGEEREPAESLRADGCCEWCASSCASTTFCSPGVNGSWSIVSQKTTRRDGPMPIGIRVRLVGVGADLLDAQRDVARGRARARSGRPPRGAPCRGAARSCEVEVRATNDEERGDRDEHRRAREPPALAEPAREPHDDERARSRSRGTPRRAPPSPRRASRGSRGRSGRSGGPTSGRRRGTAVRTSQAIAEPEHPEQHPRADRAGRRLARERDPAPRVDPRATTSSVICASTQTT